MSPANVKFLPVERALDAMSKQELREFYGDEKYWPIYLNIEGKDWAICSIHFSKGGTQKAANKIVANYPESRFIAFGTGWETSVGLYVHPPIESVIEALRANRREEQ